MAIIITRFNSHPYTPNGENQTGRIDFYPYRNHASEIDTQSEGYPKKGYGNSCEQTARINRNIACLIIYAEKPCYSDESTCSV